MVPVLQLLPLDEGLSEVFDVAFDQTHCKSVNEKQSIIEPKNQIMKSAINQMLIVVAMFAGVHQIAAQGTAFTYQGQLNNSGIPANGLYDFQYSLSNSPSGGNQVGSTLTITAVPVTNGLFTSTLDFGYVFTGNATWLAISVRTNGAGSYVGLQPLQPLTPTPYAIYSATAGSASSVAATNIVGTMPLTQLPSAVLTNNASNVNLTGTFSGDGSGLYNTVTTANYVSAYDVGNHINNAANTFQDISFSAMSLSGWTYIGGGGATFTCPQTGVYFVQYSAEAETTSSSTTTISLRVFNLATDFETSGSESSVILSMANQPIVISKSFLATFAAGNAIQIQFTGSNTSAELIAGIGAATYQPSISLTIVRIQ